MDYQLVTDSLDVPKHAGIEGFIHAIRGILRLSRVVGLEVDSRGKVTYRRYVRPEEPRKTIQVDFDSVAPSAVVRNGTVQELDLSEFQHNAAVAVAVLFQRAASEQMFPVGWIVSPTSRIWDWHRTTTGVGLIQESAYGLPIFKDRHIPDESLLFAMAYARDAALIDTQMAYKILIPSTQELSLPAKDSQ